MSAIDLTEKSALVLGGVGGIGKAVVDHLLASGVRRIGVIDIVDETKAREVLDDLLSRAKGVQFVYIKSEVQDEPALRSAMQDIATKLKGLDMVFNSVGILDEQDPKKMIMINFVSISKGPLLRLLLHLPDLGRILRMTPTYPGMS